MNQEEIDMILNDHISWVNTQGFEGTQADLRKADLRGANLRKANLCCVSLRCADLRNADLSGVDLRNACLPKGVRTLGMVCGWLVTLHDNILSIGCNSYPIDRILSWVS